MLSLLQFKAWVDDTVGVPGKSHLGDDRVIAMLNEVRVDLLCNDISEGQVLRGEQVRTEIVFLIGTGTVSTVKAMLTP